MVWVDGFDVGGKPYFNMIFRPEDGTVWQAEVGLDAAHYQTEFDKWVNAGYRPLHVETFLNGGNVLYAGIWVKNSGPAWSAYHGRSAAFHQSQFDTLTKEGFVPVVVSAVETSGGLLYTALYEKTDVGGFILSGALDFHDYQTQTNANIAAGRHPASLNAISNGGNPLMLGLWEQKASAEFVARNGQTAAQYQAEYDLAPAARLSDPRAQRLRQRPRRGAIRRDLEQIAAGVLTKERAGEVSSLAGLP